MFVTFFDFLLLQEGQQHSKAQIHETSKIFKILLGFDPKASLGNKEWLFL